MTTKLLRTLMGMVALVAMLTACSSEDVLLDEPNAKNEITFNVTTNRASRAVQVFNSTNLPTYFRFCAWQKGNDVTPGVYVQKDLVKLENGSWINQNGLRYWPGHGETLDFFAWCCGDKDPSSADHATLTFNSTSENPSLDFDVQYLAQDQTDLIYATAIGENRDDEINSVVQAKQKVEFNFKHALSQIVFKAKNESNKIHVEIKEIGIAGIEKGGKFEFPLTKGGTGNWTSYHGMTDAFPENGPEIAQFVNCILDNPCDIKYNTLVDVTSMKQVNTENDNPEDYAFMLIPQEKTKNIANGQVATWDKAEGPYLVIKCKIWNVANPQIEEFQEDDAEGGYIWQNYGWSSKDNIIYGSTSEYAELRIPLSIKWVQGKRYVYTLLFGKGNAGYDKDGKAAIVPMTYDVNISDWNDDPNATNEPGNGVNG